MSEDDAENDAVAEYVHPSASDADAVVERARDEGVVIDFAARIGAHPYMAFTPYVNNRGVRVHMWSCISYSFTRMPERTLLSTPTIVDPADYDDYEVRLFTTEWVWGQVFRSRLVRLIERDESPFAGGVIGGWDRGDPDAE